MKENKKFHRSWSSAWNMYTKSRGRAAPKGGFWKLFFIALAGFLLIFYSNTFFRSKLRHESTKMDLHTTARHIVLESNQEDPRVQIQEVAAVEDPKEPSEQVEEEYDPQLWRHLHSYNFQPRVSEWNEKRARYMASNPPLREGKKNVLQVTGSQPRPCQRLIGNHLVVKAAKNKIDYCRLHDIPLYYNMAHPEADLGGWWVKLSVIRMLILGHPEVEWIWWVDSDAVFTDMTFVPKFESYEGFNLVLYGDEHMIYELKDWKGINTGDFFIRNCQWSLDLLDAWASMGPDSVNEEAGTLLSKTLFGREDWAADDQSGIVYLLVTERKRWASKVHFERSFAISGDWVTIAPRFEELLTNLEPGFGDYRCPFITHFAGCQPCSKWNQSDWDDCRIQIERSFDFSDHQVYQRYGFNISKLGSANLVRVQSPDSDVQLQLSDWDEQRKDSLNKNLRVRKPRVMLVSGSPTQQCSGGSMASYILLRGMKNKVDYSRLHDIDFFHNSLDLDLELTGSGWSKIPVIKALMLSHPELEWIWWVDNAAIFTDMSIELPLEKYQGKNLVLWGDEKLVFDNKSPSGLNTGDFLLRNCQWSLDLLDAWAAMGYLDGRQEAGNILNNELTDRPEGLEADDRSSLVFGLVRQKYKWASKVFFESPLLFGSGDWMSLTERFEEMSTPHHPDLPFVTHFAGCELCESTNSENGSQRAFLEEQCLEHMERALDFADNQVLGRYGLQHLHLGTPEVLKIVKP